ncbi:hypothetical protein LCGC14_1201590 [marine sediment metagenome]|uniref:Uncharacterized protein n=1 Tax=marine sediment metagenome TaxID=412755 RepID=A0A0F9LL54_9ZZZZ
MWAYLGYSMSEQEPMFVAKEIMSQLKMSKVNGFPFFMYSGAREFVGGDKFLQFRIPNRKRIAKIRVVLDEARDLYNLEFYKKKGFEMKKSKSIDGIFFDQMAEIIVRELGIN